MKKIFLMVAVAASALTANAQAEYGYYGDKFFDNWYIGVNGDLSSAPTHNAFLKNINPGLGLRIGKYIDPTFGFGFELDGKFTNKIDYANGNYTDGKAVRYLQVGLYGTLNLSNALGGYNNAPRDIEVSFIPGLYLGHNYGNGNVSGAKGWTDNHLLAKFGLNFAYNFGSDKQWQLYLEPSINYAFAGILDEETGMGNKEIGMNINASYVNLAIGLNYKFKTSNGTHNFLCTQPCNTEELNDEINNLRAQNAANTAALQSKPKVETKTVVVHDTVYVNAQAAPNLPSVFFQCNKSNITNIQQNNVRIAAEVLKKNPEYKVAVKGYASIEGAADNNNSLGVRRANAVKDMLVKTYGIDPSRITATGCGATDEFSPVLDLNRVSMMILEK